MTNSDIDYIIIAVRSLDLRHLVLYFIGVIFMKENKYEYDIKKLQERLKSLRFNSDGTKKYTQAKLAEELDVASRRTTVTAWENDKKTIPDTETLIKICNLFDCDLDYLFGKSDIKSQDIQTISNVLHISEESINTLRYNKEYGQLINNMINNKFFGEISRRAHQLALNKVLKDVITTSFNEHFEDKVKNIFDKYYFSVFPIEMSQKKYCEYIKSAIPYSEEFNPVEFIENNFLDNGKLFIYNKNDDFLSLAEPEQYEIIIASIADISYNYYISQNVAELSKQKLDLMLSELLQTAINEDANEIKARIKKNATQMQEKSRLQKEKN